MKILVISDSHGAGYSGFSFVNYLKEEYDVKLLGYGGVPVNKIHKHVDKLNNKDRFDLLILQVGNPDVHPRLPTFLKISLKKLCERLSRESTYALPADFSLKYIIKLPLFFVKRILVFFLTPEFYNTPEEIVCNIEKIGSSFGGKVVVVSLFQVDEFFYGSSHNENVKDVNLGLENIYAGCFLSIDGSSVKDSLCADRFHFGEKAHILISEKIEFWIKNFNKY